ncbi:MAG TPA: methylenetetrahydrofolate reductase [NAD(P)H] [Gemmataceae bacterium]|nr:methylenetetrahydrofolate reductase [NAD(P)H] [Gemmataceae bacterium]
MKIRELFALPGTHVSFEFFPPPTEVAEATLFRDVVPALKQLGPRFFSVTYGAGGGTRDNTIRVVDRIRKDYGVEAMAHLTCVGHTQQVLGEVLDQVLGLGIDNILCLRGDPPKGETKFVATEGGFANAIDLIRFVRKRSTIGIGAACYPEGHVECPDRQLDWDRAAAKVEAGADFLITQLFYDLDPFYEMEDYLVNKKGVKVPIVPGILPILNTAQIKRFTKLCGAHIPPDLMVRLEEHAADDQAVRQIGVEHATEMCTRLIAHGSEGLHFYCLNRVPSSSEVIKNLHLV